MKSIKKLLLIFSCVYLSSCNNISEEKVIEINPFDFLDSISIDELESLKGISIATRRQGESIDRFYVTYKDSLYHLPIYNSFKTKEKIMNSEWYDVVKFARNNDVDSVSAYDYVRDYTNRVLLVYTKSKAIGIQSDLKLGDFIIFRYPKQQIVYRFPNGQIIEPFWKEYFGKTKEIKKGWFIESSETKK